MDIIEPVELIMWIFAGKDQQTPSTHLRQRVAGLLSGRSADGWDRGGIN